AFRFRIDYEVTASQVTVSVQHFFKRERTSTPLGQYVALITTTVKEPGFFGARKVLQILLWHQSSPEKQVVLLTTANQALFDRRIEIYQQLFRLPLNPT